MQTPHVLYVAFCHKWIFFFRIRPFHMILISPQEKKTIKSNGIDYFGGNCEMETAHNENVLFTIFDKKISSLLIHSF